MRPATTTIVAAGRIVPNRSPWTARTAGMTQGRYVDPRPDDVGEGEAAVGQGPLDRLERRPRLRAAIDRVTRPAVRAGIGAAGHPA